MRGKGFVEDLRGLAIYSGHFRTIFVPSYDVRGQRMELCRFNEQTSRLIIGQEPVTETVKERQHILGTVALLS